MINCVLYFKEQKCLEMENRTLFCLFPYYLCIIYVKYIHIHEFILESFPFHYTLFISSNLFSTYVNVKNLLRLEKLFNFKLFSGLPRLLHPLSTYVEPFLKGSDSLDVDSFGSSVSTRTSPTTPPGTPTSSTRSTSLRHLLPSRRRPRFAHS